MTTIKAVEAVSVPPRPRQSSYPEPFLSRIQKREKRALGDHFGLKNFGVNLTRLYPGGESPFCTGTASKMSLSTFSKANRRLSPTKARSLFVGVRVRAFRQKA